jgi:predicted GNAT family N-acyltransferase
MNIEVREVSNKKELELVFRIRETVFVREQQVAPEDEYDEFEDHSTHFLATINGEPAGTARWRRTENGIKLERFAVLPEKRRTGIGQALVKAVLDDIAEKLGGAQCMLYLHAQLPAIPLYAKFGFIQKGDLFMECGIAHYSMIKNIKA